MIRVQRVTSAALTRRWASLPERLHRSRPGFVPTLRSAALAAIDPRRNPFHLHAHIAHFIAIDDGVDDGRISTTREPRRAHGLDRTTGGDGRGPHGLRVIRCARRAGDADHMAAKVGILVEELADVPGIASQLTVGEIGRSGRNFDRGRVPDSAGRCRLRRRDSSDRGRRRSNASAGAARTQRFGVHAGRRANAPVDWPPAVRHRRRSSIRTARRWTVSPRHGCVDTRSKADPATKVPHRTLRRSGVKTEGQVWIASRSEGGRLQKVIGEVPAAAPF